jgi:hypothetical protein
MWIPVAQSIFQWQEESEINVDIEVVLKRLPLLQYRSLLSNQTCATADQ